MNIFQSLLSVFRRPIPVEKEVVGVWVFFNMDGPFVGMEVCEDTTQSPPKRPALLIVDRTLSECLHLVGKSIDWGRFRFHWRKELEQGLGYCRFRHDELKDWIK